MFPETFARDSIEITTKPGDVVFDPFCGRGTTILEALLHDRQAIGCDINPVAAAVSQAKAHPPALKGVLARINDLRREFQKTPIEVLSREIRALPLFFDRAYSNNTLLQIWFLRKVLGWRKDRRDLFICALLLGHLHGESNKSPSYLSNQMPHTIAVKPRYAIRYWHKNQYFPPERNVFALLAEKAVFRLEEGVPNRIGEVIQEDARQAYCHFRGYTGKVTSVITSPPYFNVTNFEEDQWLRLWFLGGKPYPTYSDISSDDRHTNLDKYFRFLTEVWQGIAPLLQDKAHIVCRIGAKKLSSSEIAGQLSETIRSVWPAAQLVGELKESCIANRQTEFFRPGSVGCKKEYDFLFALG